MIEDDADIGLGSLPLGDMTVFGSDQIEPKLLKALAVIAAHLHPTFERQDWIKGPDWSKESCVLCSLTACDFLRSIGFDANVRPCALVLRSEADGATLHSLGMGHPDSPLIIDGRWNGHLIVTLPREQVMIDTTLYPAVRPQWRGSLPGMLALHTGTLPKLNRVFGLRPFAGLVMTDPDDASFEFNALWLDWPKNRAWREGGDAQEWRRATVRMTLREEFGVWR
jgi:hypothetical protein